MSNKQKRILIAGYYGFGNTGDDAILRAILAQLCQHRKDLEFIVVSADPAETMATFNVNSVHWKDVEGLLRAAQESDLIILGGGGLFQDYWGVPKDVALTPSHWGISFCSAIAMLAVLYQKPFVIYSVGVGPVDAEEGKQLTRWTFDLANIASVRDLESRDLLISLGVPGEKILIAPDPALTLPFDFEAASKILESHGMDSNVQPLVGVCIRNWSESEKADLWEKALAASLDTFLETHDVQVVFIPFQVQEHILENDHRVALDIASMMQKHDSVSVLAESYSPEVVGGLIAHCKLIVGMRLHSLIFAATAEVPAVALVYDPKVDSFMKSLEFSEYAIHLENLTADELLGILNHAFEQQEPIKELLRIRTNTLKKSAEELPRMALNLLNKTSKLPFSMEAVQHVALEQTRGLARKELEVQTLASQVQALSSQLAATNLEMQDLSSQLAAANLELQNLSSQLNSKYHEIGLLQNQLQAQQREMELRQAQYGAQVQDFQSQIGVLQNELAAQRHQLSEILSSKTWKLAEGFRKLRFWLVPVGGRREQLAKTLYRSSASILYKISKAIALVRYSIRRHGLLMASVRGLRILGIRIYHWNKRVLDRNKYERELKQLDSVISQHTGFFDLFHVPMGWNTILFQRFQHVSLQTAKLGGLALYGGHPIVDRGITVYQKVAKNLYVFDATNREVVDKVFQSLDGKKQQPRILRIQSIDLVTTEDDVYRFIQAGFAVVYEYIDEINPAITGNVPESVYQRHNAILKDERVIVVATSDQLAEEVRQFRSRNFILSTNGVDLDHWRIPKGKPPADLAPVLNGNRLVLGYHGALAKWMDCDLLRAIADEGDYEVVLIGHEHDNTFAESGLKSHPRVHFLGSKTYFELNAYAAYYDIAILPFKQTALTQAVSPVKIFEYMAARKPVVTTDLRECRKYQSCLIGSTHEQFREQLKRAAGLRNDSNYLALLDKEASENSWERKTIEILRLAGVKI